MVYYRERFWLPLAVNINIFKRACSCRRAHLGSSMSQEMYGNIWKIMWHGKVFPEFGFNRVLLKSYCY